MPGRMVKLTLEPNEASLARVRKRLKLAAGDVDADFGLVSLDPAAKLYAILVRDEVADKLEGTAGVAGVYSNPRIEPFGPPKK